MTDATYDALNPKGRRRKASIESIKPEDILMTQSRRDDITANAYDVHRNVAMLQWMVRQTLNYCCTFDFQPVTGDDSTNQRIRELMTRDCQAENLDYVGRMDWDDHRRVAESLKITSGDCFHIPLRERTLQLIEGTHCRNPKPESYGDGDRWIGGAKLNRRSRVTKWNFREVQLINTVRETVDRKIPARNVWQHVQYENRATVRGLSPITSVLNEIRDVYEGFDHARAKMKLDQLFGIAIFRNPDDQDDLADNVDADGTAADADPGTEEEHYDFGKGPVVMDRDVGEDVKLLQSSSPARETQEFLKLCLLVALAALDLPFNFLDSSSTNFFGSRAAWILYDRSCMARRKAQLRLHHRMTQWRLLQWTQPEAFGGTGELALPKSMRIEDLRYKWIARGMPWWKPAEELETNLRAAAAGLKTMQGICDEHDLGLYEENVKQLRIEQDMAAKYGFNLELNPSKLSASLQPAMASTGDEL